MSNPMLPLDGVPAAARSCVSGEDSPPLRVLPATSQTSATDGDLERALVAFDPEDDMAQIIPMPLAIPPAVRVAITQALGRRFEFADELDDWLHNPNDALAAATPFERIVAGDGLAVLVALLGPGDHPELRRLIPTSGSLPRLALHLVR